MGKKKPGMEPMVRSYTASKTHIISNKSVYMQSGWLDVQFMTETYVLVFSLIRRYDELENDRKNLAINFKEKQTI